jgi:hypothetical protein
VRTLAPVVLAAAAVVVLVIRAVDGSIARQTERLPSPLTSWETPTDFLLETPGYELLRTIPEMGQTSGWKLGAPTPAAPSDTDMPHPERRPS